MNKAIVVTLAILWCCGAAMVLVPVLTGSHSVALTNYRSVSQPAAAAHSEPPAWIKENPSANDAYRQAEQIMTNPKYSRKEKQDRMRVLQRNFGEELVTTVVRYVPVYDEESGTYVSFDAYMRQMAQDYPPSDTDAPINYDPIGATMRIFFDPSAETIAAMTGIGLSPEQVEAARAKYEEDQRQREAATARTEAQLKSAWEQLTRQATDVARETQEQAKSAVEEAQRQAEQAAREAQERLDQLQREAEQAAREVQDQLNEALKGIEEGLKGLFGWSGK